MKKIFLTIMLVLGIIGFSEDSMALELKKVVVTDEILNKVPAPEKTEFSLYEKGYLYTEILDIGEEKTLLHKWYFEEENGEKNLTAIVPLKIRGNRWRTWSSKNLYISGKWIVEVVVVLEGNEQLLETKEFVVE